MKPWKSIEEQEKRRPIEVIEIDLDDGIIAHLETAEEPMDINLMTYIQAYAELIDEEHPDIQIFHQGNHYLVLEDCIYVAVYKDEISIKFRITNILKNLRDKFGSKKNS